LAAARRLDTKILRIVDDGCDNEPHVSIRCGFGDSEILGYDRLLAIRNTVRLEISRPDMGCNNFQASASKFSQRVKVWRRWRKAIPESKSELHETTILPPKPPLNGKTRKSPRKTTEFNSENFGVPGSTSNNSLWEFCYRSRVAYPLGMIGMMWGE
jgi:hypothetical protein